jgi:hypothetical protein
MKCERIFCAEIVIIDRNENKLSAINVWDDIDSKSFPLVIPLMMFIKLQRNEGEPNAAFKIQFKIDNNVLVNNTIPFHFPDGINVAGTIVNMGLFTISTAGTLSIGLFSGDNEQPFHTIQYIIKQNAIQV